MNLIYFVATTNIDTVIRAEAVNVVNFLEKKHVEYFEIKEPYPDIEDYKSQIDACLADGYIVVCVGLEDEEYAYMLDERVYCVFEDLFITSKRLYNEISRRL